MLKIALVITRLNIGGTARYIENLALGLNNKGYEVRGFAGAVRFPESEDEFSHSPLVTKIKNLSRPLRPLRDFRAFLELKRQIEEYKPSVIHSHTFKAGMLTRLLPSNIKRIHTFHGQSLTDPEFNKIQKMAVWAVEYALRNRCVQYVVTGNFLGEYLEKKQILKGKKWISIEPHVHQLETQDKRAMKLFYGFEREAIVIGWLGRFAPVKRPEIFLDIASKFPEFNFLMAGHGNLEIERDLRNLRLVIGADVSKILSASDILLNTSASEGLSFSIIEAQQCGVPVISFNVGGNSEIIDNGKTGYLVNTLEDMILKTKELALQSKKRKIFSKNAMRKNTKRYSARNFIEKHITLYEAS